jgi:hypothetical protein
MDPIKRNLVVCKYYDDTELLAQLQSGIVHFVEKVIRFDGTWRYKLEVQGETSDDPWLEFDIASRKGEGKNCVEAKIATLRANPGMVSTGNLDLPADQRFLAPDKCFFYGGLQIPCAEYIGGDLEPKNVLVRSAFSGALELTDLSVAAYGLRTYEDIIQEIAKEIHFEFDHTGLYSEERTAMFAGMCGLRVA